MGGGGGISGTPDAAGSTDAEMSSAPDAAATGSWWCQSAGSCTCSDGVTNRPPGACTGTCGMITQCCATCPAGGFPCCIRFPEKTPSGMATGTHRCQCYSPASTCQAAADFFEGQVVANCPP